MTKAIFFDMDGTLFRTNSILGEALHNTFELLRQEGKWHAETPLQLYYDIMGVPLPVVWEKLCPHFDEEERERCNGIFHEQLLTAIHDNKGSIYPQVHETLAKLQLRYPLFVTSNGEVAYLQAIVETFHLQHYFKQVYSIQQIDSLNKSQLVGLAMQQHNVTDGYVVGDRLSDINAAKFNGLTSIGVNFDFAQQSELQQADYIVDELQQLLHIIAQ